MYAYRIDPFILANQLVCSFLEKTISLVACSSLYRVEAWWSFHYLLWHVYCCCPVQLMFRQSWAFIHVAWDVTRETASQQTPLSSALTIFPHLFLSQCSLSLSCRSCCVADVSIVTGLYNVDFVRITKSYQDFKKDTVASIRSYRYKMDSRRILLATLHSKFINIREMDKLLEKYNSPQLM